MEEVEALQAIYGFDLEQARNSDGSCTISFVLNALENGCRPKFGLSIDDRYPSSDPFNITVMISDLGDHSRDLTNLVETLITSQISQWRGQNMLFDLIQYAQTCIADQVEIHRLQAEEARIPIQPQPAIVPPRRPNPVPVTSNKVRSNSNPDEIMRKPIKPLPELDAYLKAIQEDAYWVRLIYQKKKLTAIPDEVFDNPLIHDMDLSHNSIFSISPRISTLSHLTKLYLQNNEIEELPIQFCNLQQLTTLNLSKNKLKSLPENLGLLTNLACLTVEHNQLEAMPESLGSLQKLTTLEIAHNRLKMIPAQIVDLELNIFRCVNNPLVHPPPEVYHRGLFYVKKYIRENLGLFLSLPASGLREEMIQIFEKGNFPDFSLKTRDGKEIPLHRELFLQNCSDYQLAHHRTLEIGYDSEMVIPVLKEIYSQKSQDAHLDLQPIRDFFKMPSLQSDPKIFLNSMYMMLMKPIQPDVSFRSEDGGRRMAHRFICSRLEYFQAMFTFDSQRTDFDLDCTSDCQDAILEFVYTDDIEHAITDHPDIILELAVTASRFGLDRLVNICENIIGYNLDVDNVCSIYGLAHDHQLHRLKPCCMFFMLNNRLKIKSTDGFRELSDELRANIQKEIDHMTKSE
eukprot:TRINITY_DN8842_c0_g1_i1.p1 TRINITY_DN8842_c0_g1~~TRINITY_DN8842_c0_g1_i1.p1  ORF type:complete len:646 (+),score=167.29 TRINITY_DN8842_c0_g1_i1:56-1939(+)